MATFTDRDRLPLLADKFTSGPMIYQSRWTKTILQACSSVILRDISRKTFSKKVDMASMMYSLEVRVPFLDYRLVPLVLSLPDKYKIPVSQNKWLLKKIAFGIACGRDLSTAKRELLPSCFRMAEKICVNPPIITDREYHILAYDSSAIMTYVFSGSYTEPL